MDILRTPWLPYDSGVGTPLEVLRRGRSLRWYRGDWDVATFCLLHALVQSAVVLKLVRCPDRAAWIALRRGPPTDLDSLFDLDLGLNPWECPTAQGLVPVASLLPESPGENAIKKASDIARWSRDVPDSLSLSEATIALISDNLWGTRIGAGHRQGARGEQALSTLVEPVAPDASLWERVWLNVLPADAWAARYQDAAPFELPWTQPLPQGSLTPANCHSLSLLWQMPRRWRLVVDPDGRVRHAHRQNHGRDYDGWEGKHPFTPYFLKADGTWTARKVGPHTGFKDWAGIALACNPKTQVAPVVFEYVQNGWDEEPLRLRCCGWALGSTGAAGGWIDHVVPFYVKGADQAAAIEQAIGDTEAQRQQLWGALNSLETRLGRHAEHIYIHMETAFFRRVAGDDWEGWKADLRRGAVELFWSVADDHGADVFRASHAARRL